MSEHNDVFTAFLHIGLDQNTTVQRPGGQDRKEARCHAGRSKALRLRRAGQAHRSPDKTRDVVERAERLPFLQCARGLRQKVANYPGVTVERKEGAWPLAPGALPARLVDLPGLYSLDATSIDEQIAHDVIGGKSEAVPLPDAVVAVVDATNIERNLFLVTQVMEMGRPVVVALTMMDLARRRQIDIDVAGLSRALGAPIVPVSASHGEGLAELAQEVLRAAARGGKPAVEHDTSGPRWQEEVVARYERIERIVDGNVSAPARRLELSERIDSVLTHRLLGPVILLAVTFLIFQVIFSWASVPMDLIDGAFGMLQEAVRGGLPPGILAELLADGVIAGVGGVLVFLPQILLLFLFIAVLEDSG
jgi:ferrous iron transport protein B